MNSVNYDQIQHNYDVVSTGNVHIITVGTGPEAHEISVLNLVNDNVIEENVDFILLMKTDMGSSMIGTLYGRFHAEDPVFSSGQFGMTLINSDYYLNLQHTSGDGYVVITDANGDNIDDDFGVTLLKLKNSPLTSDNFDEIYAAIGTTNFLRSWIEVAGINNMINDALAQANIPDIYGFYSMKFKKLVDTRLGS